MDQIQPQIKIDSVFGELSIYPEGYQVKPEYPLESLEMKNCFNLNVDLGGARAGDSLFIWNGRKPIR